MPPELIDSGVLLAATLNRDWLSLSLETGYSPTRLTQLALAAIDDPSVIAEHPVECRMLADRRAAAQQARRASWGM